MSLLHFKMPLWPYPTACLQPRRRFLLHLNIAFLPFVDVMFYYRATSSRRLANNLFPLSSFLPLPAISTQVLADQTQQRSQLTLNTADILHQNYAELLNARYDTVFNGDRRQRQSMSHREYRRRTGLDRDSGSTERQTQTETETAYSQLGIQAVTWLSSLLVLLTLVASRQLRLEKKIKTVTTECLSGFCSSRISLFHNLTPISVLFLLHQYTESGHPERRRRASTRQL